MQQGTRRRFLRNAGALLAGSVLGPAAVGCAAGTVAGSGPETGLPHPDELFRTGRFADADRGYAEIVDRDPGDAHALAHRGYIALLSHRFTDAETFLAAAIALAPNDTTMPWWLADCYVRQNDFARAAPLLRAAARDAEALQHQGISAPYEITGPETVTLPFLATEPLPVVEMSVNGQSPKPFFLDTGATVGLSAELAAQAGVRSIATAQGRQAAHSVTRHLGVADALDFGGLEVRNVPVSWIEGPNLIPPLPDGTRPHGALGTTIFQRLIATMDYARAELVLRRRTATQFAAVRDEATRTGNSTAPLYMAPTHHLFTEAGVQGHGPMLAGLDTGGGGVGVVLSTALADRAGIPLDRQNRRRFGGADVLGLTADAVALGSVIRDRVQGITDPIEGSGHGGLNLGFHADLGITHGFFAHHEPKLALTFDFEDMILYVSEA